MECDHVVMSLEHYEELKAKVAATEKKEQELKDMFKNSAADMPYVAKDGDYAYMNVDLTPVAEALKEFTPEGWEFPKDWKNQSIWFKKPEIEEEGGTI